MQPNNNNQNRPPKANGGGKKPANPRRQGSGKPGGNGQKAKPGLASNLTTSRGEAVRAQRRSQADAQRIANQYISANVNPESGERRRANVIDDSPRLKIIGLGGMD